MKYIQLQVVYLAGTLDLLQTLNFSLLLEKLCLPEHSGSNPDARFNSPVNGLESSALLLQF